PAADAAAGAEPGGWLPRLRGPDDSGPDDGAGGRRAVLGQGLRRPGGVGGGPVGRLRPARPVRGPTVGRGARRADDPLRGRPVRRLGPHRDQWRPPSNRAGEGPSEGPEDLLTSASG